jgi:tetratricopeptide (TPR) repeat protein
VTKLHWLCLAVLAGLVAALYGHTFHYPFQYDDELFVQLPAGMSIWSWFIERSAGMPNRVLTFATFGLNHLVAVNDTFSFHITNTTVHFLASTGVFFLTWELAWHRLGLGRAKAFLAACSATALFAVHPVQTQAVTFIWQRAASMTAAFGIWATWSWLRALRKNSQHADRVWLAVSVLMSVAAMLSKENGVVVPVFILLAEFASSRTTGRIKQFVQQRHLILLALALVVPVMHLVYDSANVVDMSYQFYPVTWFTFLMTETHVLFKYFQLSAWPSDLTLDYDFPITGSPDVRTFFAALFHTLFVIWGFFLLWRRQLVGFAILGFYCLISVEASVIPLTDAIVEHRLYFPLLALTLTAGLVLGRSRLTVVQASVPLVILLTALAAQTVRRNQVWENRISLWSDVVAKAPDKHRGYENLAIAQIRSGKTEEAQANFARSFITGNKSPRFLENYLNALLTEHRPDEARRLVELFPDERLDPFAKKMHMARIYQTEGKFPASLAMLDDVLEKAPDHSLARYLTVSTLIRMGRTKLAAEHFAKLKEDGASPLEMADLNTRLLYAHSDQRFLSTYQTAAMLAADTFPDTFQLATLARDIHLNTEAEQLFRKTWHMGAQVGLIELAVLKTKLGQEDSVPPLIQEFIAEHPTDKTKQSQVIAALAERQLWQPAEQLLQYLLDLEQNDNADQRVLGALNYNLAVTCFFQKKTSLAKTYAEKAARLGHPLPAAFKSDLSLTF